MTRKSVSKIIAYVTAVCTMAVMCGMPAVAFAAGSGITKEETVYVVTDSSGTQDDVIVSDHLVNKDKEKKIADETTLTDIENVKGEETFKQKGDALTWDAEGNSIYYQGRTDAEVPVTMDVTYRLNDKAVSGPELQGQSGKVEIRIRYENNAEFEGSTVPFVVMTGLIVTDDSFKNIKITKGKVIDDGEKLLVVGMAAPGLAQMLGVGESELGIGSNVTITGDADKFAVEDMMTIVTNAFFEDVDADGINLDYDDEINDLDKGTKALVEGSKLLYDGLNEMNDKMPGLKSGVNQLKTGADELSGYASQAQIGATDLNTGVQLIKDLPEKLQELSDGLTQLKATVDELLPKVTEMKTGIDGAISALTLASTYQQNVVDYLSTLRTKYNKLSEEDKEKVKAVMGDDVVNDLDATITKAGSVKATIDQVKGSSASGDDPATGLVKVSEGIDKTNSKETLVYALNALSTNLGGMNAEISPLLPSLTAGVPKLVDGAQDMKDGLDQLAPGAKDLAAGMADLQDQSGTLIGGVQQLDKGALDLSNGMSKLYREGIKKIVDMYRNDLKGTLDNARSMLDAGKGYKTFTKLPSGMDGNVKFIYKTDMTK